MSSRIFVIGISWRTAPVALREQLAFSSDAIPPALEDLVSSPSLDEALILSTCNRVEIYGSTPPSASSSVLASAAAEARSVLVKNRSIDSDAMADAVFERVDSEATTHVFRVASALDSMVVGESQILGQLKQAYGVAVHTGAAGGMLGRLLEHSFGVAKRVRSETDIARGAANVSSVAVELTNHVFGNLSGKHVLVVGAGKMSALAARYLRRDGAASIRVTNRSFLRAKALAEEIEGEAREWEQLPVLVAGADVIISSTGASEPVLTHALLKKAMKKRRYRPQVIVDIAVPRDVEKRVGKIDGVYLFDIDDLRQVVDRNLRERAKESVDAEKIVENEVESFERWRRSQRVVPTIRSLREHFAAIAKEETDKVIRLLERDHTEEERSHAISRLGEVIVNKLLHLPMTALKEEDRDVEALVEAAEALFKLEGRRAATSDALRPSLAGPAEAGGESGGKA